MTQPIAPPPAGLASATAASAGAIAPAAARSSLAQSSTSLSLQIRNVQDLRALAAVFAASGFFGKGARSQAEVEARCAVQLLAGMEAGFTPFASITGVFLVEGKPGFSAQLLAQAIKRHPDYDYRVREKTSQCCRIEFFSRGESLGVEEFTLEMAQRAGLAGKATWRSYPEAMLFNRAISAGMRTHCPDALGGHTPYTPEEIGGDRFGEIDENGMVKVQVIEDSPPPPAVDRDQLQARVLARLRDLGVTQVGMRTLLQRAGGPDCHSVGMLPDAALHQLATGTITPEKVQDWNSEGSAQPAPQQPQATEEGPAFPDEGQYPDDDDQPALWAMADEQQQEPQPEHQQPRHAVIRRGAAA